MIYDYQINKLLILLYENMSDEPSTGVHMGLMHVVVLFLLVFTG